MPGHNAKVHLHIEEAVHLADRFIPGPPSSTKDQWNVAVDGPIEAAFRTPDGTLILTVSSSSQQLASTMETASTIETGESRESAKLLDQLELLAAFCLMTLCWPSDPKERRQLDRAVAGWLRKSVSLTTVNELRCDLAEITADSELKVPVTDTEPSPALDGTMLCEMLGPSVGQQVAEGLGLTQEQRPESEGEGSLTTPDIFGQFTPVYGYRITQGGVFEEVMRDDDHKSIPLTYKPCGVMALCRDADGLGWGVLIGWYDQDGKAHQWSIPRGRLHEQGWTLATELATMGLPIVAGMERKLLRYLVAANPKRRLRASSQTGWQSREPLFVLPNRVIGRTTTDEAPIYQPDRYSPTSQSVHERGTLEEWKAEVAAQCEGNPILTFLLSASLAAPLLHLLNQEGGGFHFYGTTSQGKTTALQVAASVWGDGADPTHGSFSTFVQKWNTTKNATEGLAEAHNDLPLCLDEIGEVDTKEFGRMIYQLAGGRGKARMQADSSQQKPKTWRTLVLSSGEDPAAAVVEAEGKRIKGGQAVRLLDIPVTDPQSGEGVIMTRHGAESSGIFVDGVKQACANYYGTAGPAFINALIKEEPSRVRDDLKRALRTTAEALTSGDVTSEVQRVIWRFALVAVAGEKAIDLGILPWQPGEATKAVKVILDRYLEARGGIFTDSERGIESVRNFILAHASSRFRPFNDQIVRVHNLAGYINKDTICFTSEGFKEACGGYDPQAVARSLYECGWLRKVNSGRWTRLMRIPGLDQIRVYEVSRAMLHVNANVPLDDGVCLDKTPVGPV